MGKGKGKYTDVPEGKEELIRALKGNNRVIIFAL